ncbi:MAG TPA: YfiR/HmsC family protein [Prolixibacteraceae bacterium]|nr:YfiR/HmsC family protein [Prolixibacteraceae bacterium]
MKNVLKYFLLGIILIISSFRVAGQVDRANLIGAYAFNFARYTTWPDENSRSDFKILLISDRKEIVDEFKFLSKTKKIKDKPITISSELAIPKQLGAEIRMIVLTSEKSDLFYQLNRQIEDLPILLISENFADKKVVMINLIDTPKKELLFEVNKANIINHKLQINPEILLMGGTEVDVAELYRASQKSLENMETNLQKMNDSLSMLKDSINLTLGQIKRQEESILKQRELLEEQSEELQLGRNEIARNKSEIANHEVIMGRQNENLNKQKISLDEQQIELSEQQSFINQQQKEIYLSKAILDSLATEISGKNMALDQQQEIIKRQKLTVVLFAVIGLLSIVILLFIINGSREKSRKNKLLIQQKEEIEKINSKLVTSNKSLYSTITKLSETQSQLVASEKMASLGVLTAGIAHEINNPVNFIYTGINSLRKDYDELISTVQETDKAIQEKGDEELVQKVQRIKEASELDEIMEIIPQTIDDVRIGAERAADIIKGLRNFSRIDKDSMQYSDIHEGIDSALLLLRNKFKNHITIQKEYSQLPLIECHPGKLNQAFLNIISNAIDAIEKEGKIFIRTWCDQDWGYVQIEDTGKGIPAEFIDKIFDPFFTTKTVGQGVGLGLSITFGIIKEHNGKIEVKSEVNRGTIFTISLPCTTNSREEV